MQLNPQEQFVLAYGIPNHTDSATYYVQAVIRDGKTDALLDTVNLTDNGNRRFTKSWQVPADPTGQGRYIIVTYTAYTDSGYTTKSNYGEKFDEHLIERRHRNSGGGGVDVDYQKVRKIIAEEVAKAIPDAKEIDFSPLTNALQAILSEVRGIDIPKAEKTDFSPLMAEMKRLEASVKSAIDDKEIPQTDLTALEAAISDLQELVDRASLQKSAEAANLILDRIKSFFNNDIEEIKNGIAELPNHFDTRFSQIPYVPLLTKDGIKSNEE